MHGLQKDFIENNAYDPFVAENLANSRILNNLRSILMKWVVT